jgi:hypothetical protein
MITDKLFRQRLRELTDEAIRESLAEISAEFDRRFGPTPKEDHIADDVIGVEGVKRPSKCCNALRDAGKPYPRSGCTACGNVAMMGCPYERNGLAYTPKEDAFAGAGKPIGEDAVGGDESVIEQVRSWMMQHKHPYDCAANWSGQCNCDRTRIATLVDTEWRASLSRTPAVDTSKDGSREAAKEALRRWHRDTCYPDASAGELDIGLDAILAALPTTDGADVGGYWCSGCGCLTGPKVAGLPKCKCTPPTTDASERMREAATLVFRIEAAGALEYEADNFERWKATARELAPRLRAALTPTNNGVSDEG